MLEMSDSMNTMMQYMGKVMENPIKMDDLGVPLFSETSIRYSFFLRDENRCHFWDFLSLQVDLRSKAPSWEEVTEDAQDFIRKLLQPFSWMMIQ